MSGRGHSIRPGQMAVWVEFAAGCPQDQDIAASRAHRNAKPARHWQRKAPSRYTMVHRCPVPAALDVVLCWCPMYRSECLAWHLHKRSKAQRSALLDSPFAQVYSLHRHVIITFAMVAAQSVWPKLLSLGTYCVPAKVMWSFSASHVSAFYAGCEVSWCR